MPAARSLLIVAAVVLAVGGPALAQMLPRQPKAGLPAAPRAEPDAPDSRPKSDRPSVRIGALLPLSGASAWFGKEMRQGLERAVADHNRPPGGETAVEPEVNLVLETVDVQPLNIKQASDGFARLVAAGAPVIFTSSPGPTMHVQPLAAARDVLLVHLGLPGGRLTPGTRGVLQARASIGARVSTLVAYAAEHPVRRLALLAAGDEFGKAVRATLTAAWRERGLVLAHEESLTLEAPDLPARLRALIRAAPQAVVLGFRGAELGDVAARLREAGYTGPLLLLDDDPGALLAAGPALEGALVIADAFHPEPGSDGERFAEAYAKQFSSPPSRHAATAYEAVTVVAAGIRQAMTDRRGTLGGGRLREALLALRRFPSVYGGDVRLADDGTMTRPFALFTVDGGQLTFQRHLRRAGPA